MEALLHESPLVPLREEEAEAAKATWVVPRSLPAVVHPEVGDLLRPTVRLLEADCDPVLLTHQKELQSGALLQQVQEQLQGIDRLQEEPWKSSTPQASQLGRHSRHIA